MSAVKAYVAGRETGSIPRINYSIDLGVTWNATNFNPNASLIQAIAVRQDDPNFLIVGNTYVSGDVNNRGIQYSTDGGNTWAQSGGTWPGSVVNGSILGYNNSIAIDPDTANTNVFITASDFAGAYKLLGSVNNGYSFDALTTSNIIYGSGNYPIHALAVWDNRVFAAVGAGDGLHPTKVYKSTDYGNTFSLLTFTAIPGNNVGAMYYDQTNDKLFIVALSGIYSSTAGAPYVLEYTFPYTHFVVGTIKGIDYIDGILYFNDRTTLFSSDLTFTTVTPVYTPGAGNLQDFDFYSSGKGFITANGVEVNYTADNGVNINNTNTDINFGPELVTVSPIVGCGCEPGYFWDEASQQCITHTPMCQEGMTYNPITGLCEGLTAGPCDTDIAIAVDISASVTQDEMSEYKNMLRGIIDGLEMGYDINGNLNTIANSLGRITSGEIRVGLTFYNEGLTAGPILFYGPTAWGPGGANNSPAGTLANPGTLKTLINHMGYPVINGQPDSYGVDFPSKGDHRTNSFIGLGRAYDTVWGTNSRPDANKKILFTTDGWPNYIDPNALLTDYGVTLPSIITSFGTTPANGVCGTYNTNDINSVIQATYQERRLADYIATMDLAQQIKDGSAIPYSGSGGQTDIALLISGNSVEQNITKTAFVGFNPADGSTPCYLDTSPIFGSAANSDKFDNDSTGGSVDLGSCPSWQGSYASNMGWGSENKFPSNNFIGLPIYFQTDFIPSAYANMGFKVANALLCPNEVLPVNCASPCEIVQDPTSSIYYCNCISSVPFNSCCYDLINCADNTVYASVNTTGQNNDFMAQFIGQYIFIEGVAACLYVSLNSGCTSSTTLNVTVNQITSYADCISCNDVNNTTPYYNLYSCADPGVIVFQTTTDLSSYITGGANQNLPILTFVEYPDICFTVEQTFTFLPQVVVTVDVAYNDCPTCLSYLC
jgi:hypothetical protein